MRLLPFLEPLIVILIIHLGYEPVEFHVISSMRSLHLTDVVHEVDSIPLRMSIINSQCPDTSRIVDRGVLKTLDSLSVVSH
jgi:hypothetical protein